MKKLLSDLVDICVSGYCDPVWVDMGSQEYDLELFINYGCKWWSPRKVWVCTREIGHIGNHVQHSTIDNSITETW